MAPPETTQRADRHEREKKKKKTYFEETRRGERKHEIRIQRRMFSVTTTITPVYVYIYIYVYTACISAIILLHSIEIRDIGTIASKHNKDKKKRRRRIA